MSVRRRARGGAFAAVCALCGCELFNPLDHLQDHHVDAPSSTPDGGAASPPDGSTDATLTSAERCAAASRESGLVAYFPFDEVGGSMAHDCSGRGHDAEVVSPTWTVGRVSGALAFDGATTCIDLGLATDFDLAHGFTVSAWVNVVEFADTAPNSTSRCIVGATTGIFVNGWRLATDEGPVFNLKLLATTTSPILAASPPPQAARTWLQLAAVWDPGARLEVWLGGALVGASAQSPTSFVADDATAHLRIGCYAGGSFFHGSMDELRIYDRPLPADAIQSLGR